ncbi:95_t:CDS:2, partial [Gigaspora rosea]
GLPKYAEMNLANGIEPKGDNHKGIEAQEKNIYWFQKPQKMRGIFQVDPGYQDGIEIKPNIEAPKLDNESSYEKIAPNPISGYLEEPENAGDDAETWYPCNDEIPEDWLGLNDCKDFVTSIIEDEFKSGERIEYIDKAEKAQI